MARHTKEWAEAQVEAQKGHTARTLVKELRRFKGEIFARVSIGEGDQVFLRIYKNDAIATYSALMNYSGTDMSVEYTISDGELLIG